MMAIGHEWRRGPVAAVAALGGTVAVTACFRLVPSVNSTTVGFVYLLVVLAAASLFGFPEALLASLAATAQYNYFFLPPVGAFTIADSRNWVALATFLITAMVASELSAAAKRQAREADQNRREMARLYELSRASLLAAPGDAVAQLERALVSIFGFQDVFVETPHRQPPAAAIYSQHWPLRVGQRPLGTLHLQAPPTSAEGAEAIAGLVGIALERVRVQAEGARLQGLRESEALKSALLDSVTHDLRTPLTSIKAAVTALLGHDRATAAGEEARRELLAVIDEESDALSRLLQNMLDMARIESGELRPSLRPQALAPILEEAIARARLPAQRVSLMLAEDLPLAAVDGFLLCQAVVQLLANAAAYSDPTTRIEVSATAANGELRVEIQDHGRGIPAELLPRIFDKFFRDPRARQSRPEGLGMGLAIARGIIQAHRGALQAASEADQGARFWFTVPLAPHGDLHPDR